MDTCSPLTHGSPATNTAADTKQPSDNKATTTTNEGREKEVNFADMAFGPDLKAARPWVSLRLGGLPTRLAVAGGHAAAHLSVAVVLLLLLELGVETCIK